MANSRRGEGRIDIGGQDRTMRFDFNALAELEDLHNGTPAMRLFSEERLGLKVIRDGIYVGLRGAGDRGVTPEGVGRWMSESPTSLLEWSTALTKALLSSLGQEAEAEPMNGSPLVVIEGSERNPQNGTGLVS